VSAFTELVDVASERLGGHVLACNDEFFAPASDLLKVSEPVWREGEYTDHGKWMDGWETRRRRTPGHDWCVIRLGVPARIHGVVIDTAFFRGNQPERCSIEVTDSTDDVVGGERAGAWTSLLGETQLKPDHRHPFPVEHSGRATHLRLNIFPDGGVARLRVFGEPLPPPELSRGVTADLAAIANGGLVVGCSDMSFGRVQSLILPGRSTHMGDGWETRRRRGPGHDWAIIRLGRPGVIARVEVDTDYFKGNAPESCSVDVCHAPNCGTAMPGDDVTWRPVLPRTPLAPDAQAGFEVAERVLATHARLGNYPDGGIARLRLIGTVGA
jgi:allantoicase